MTEVKGTSSDDNLYGTAQTDLIEAYEGNNNLFGRRSNDFLDGGEGKDILYGYAGNDTLVGGASDDLLNGAGLAYKDSTGSQNFGNEDVDTLTGGSGRDTFQLWGGSGRSGIDAYYNGTGDRDYALISDFDLSEDIIQLTNIEGASSIVSPVYYSLGASSDGLSTALYVSNRGKKPDLIAVLQDVSVESLSFGGNYFSFAN